MRLNLNKQIGGYFMKKLLILLILVLVTGCASKSESKDSEGLTIYTSFYTMEDFTKKIVGDKIQVFNLVKTGDEPHNWEPTPTDIASIEKADMLIYNGAGFEHWVDSVIGSIGSEKIFALNTSEGVELLEDTVIHEHDENEHEEGTHDHEDHDHENYDPHVWLNIKNAIIQLENIKNAVIKIDPENEAYYTENFNKYKEEFEALDKKYEDTISEFKNKDIVVSHKAFSYMCSEYGLNQLAIEGLSPDSEPDASRMANIVDFIKSEDIKVIFFEELASPKVAETIAKETGKEVDILSPIEGLTEEEKQNGEDYLSIMEKNLEALKRALN